MPLFLRILYTLQYTVSPKTAALNREKKGGQLKTLTAALTLATSYHCSELIQKMLINRKLLIMRLGCLPMPSKDYTPPLPAEPKSASYSQATPVTQQVPTQRTAVRRERPSEKTVRRGKKRDDEQLSISIHVLVKCM